MGCTRKQEIHKHLESVIHARVQTPRRIHGPLLFSLSRPASCRDFSFVLKTVSLPSFFSYFSTLERKNTVVYRVYMAPLYPHVRNVPRLGTAEAEPRGALSLINGTSSRTCNRRPMSNFSLILLHDFSRLIRSLNHHRRRGLLALHSASTETPFTPSLSLSFSFISHFSF